MVQHFVEVIVSFVREHQTWAIPIAFLVAFGESLCFLSLIWPGTAILVGIAGLLAASGVKFDVLWPAVISAALGGSVGYWISYWFGHHFKDRIDQIWPFTSHPDLIPHGKTFFDKYGVFGVFLGHFFGPVRAVIPVVAGMFALRQIPFQIANVSSALLWASWVILAPFFLVTFKDQIFAFMRDHETVVAGLLFLAAFLNSIPTPLMAVPTLIAFIGIGFLHLFAGGNFLPLLIAGATGAVAGDLLAYVTGRRRSADFDKIWPNSWSPESADRARGFVEKWGLPGLVPSKFHTTLRAFAPLAAGAARVSFAPYALISVVSAAIWAAALLAPRYGLQYLGW